MYGLTRPFPWLPALLLLAVLGACSAIEVTSDYDPQVNFAGYHDYAWLPGQQPRTGDVRLDNSLLHDRIRNAVDKHLAAKGYKKMESSSPDFIIAYHLALQGRLNLTTMNNYGYAPGWRGAYAGGSGSTTYVHEYDEGSLVIDVIDPVKLHLVWRGTARAEVPQTSTPEERTARIDQAVGKILEKFPPKFD